MIFGGAPAEILRRLSIPALAVLALLLAGCAAAEPSYDAGESAGSTPATSPYTNSNQLVHGLPIGEQVGHDVGYRVPDFTLELADGSIVTSAKLIEQSRPTFLFFFATT